MPATREELVKIVRDVIVRTDDQHEYFGNRAAFDAHEWVLEAMQRAYEQGHRDGCRVGIEQATALYPEGG